MARIEITTSELLEAVKTATGAHVNPDDAYTVVEISEAMSASRQLTCRRLNRLKSAGLLEVLIVERARLDGMMTKIPAYRFKTPKKARR